MCPSLILDHETIQSFIKVVFCTPTYLFEIILGTFMEYSYFCTRIAPMTLSRDTKGKRNGKQDTQTTARRHTDLQ